MVCFWSDRQTDRQTDGGRGRAIASGDWLILRWRLLLLLHACFLETCWRPCRGKELPGAERERKEPSLRPSGSGRHPDLSIPLTVLRSRKLDVGGRARNPSRLPPGCWRACRPACPRGAAGWPQLLRRSSPETGRRRKKSGCSRWSCCGSLCWYWSSSSSFSLPAGPCPPSAAGNLHAYIC